MFEKCPLVVPCEDSTTDYGIAKYLVDEVKKLEADGTALAATFFCMQPLLDINEVGNSFVFYAENEEKAEILKKKAKELAKTMMARKDGIEAVMLCLPQMEKPTIFIDSGDVLTGGAVGDSTVMIRSFLKHKFPYTYAVNLVDKKVVDKTRTMKEGEFAEFELGVSDDPDAYNAKIRVRAQYLRSSESKITFKGKSFFGLQINPGRRALLCIENSVYVIVCEHTAMLYDPEVLRDVGLEPKEFSVIVQKAHNLFKPAYKNIAKTIVNVDTLGATNQNIKSRPFKNINHPVYPFDSL